MNNWSAKKEIQHVILVDAHTLVRQALQRVVAAFPQVHVTASFGAVQDVLLSPDATGCIIVLGPSISVTDSLKLVKELRARQIRCGFVVIQQSLHRETVHVLIGQGVHSLLDESASEQDLAQAIKTASLGNIFLSQRTCTMLAVAMTRVASGLTEREIQVLSRLKHGESNFRIAYTLGLKEKTVEKYLTSIYDKLNVHSRAEAILCLQKLHF